MSRPSRTGIPVLIPQRLASIEGETMQPFGES
jgi:hypothetical protein